MRPTPGSRLGPYEIVACLGSGATAVVLRGVHHKTREEVAIKLLLAAPNAVTPRLRKRFEREVRTLSSLQHARVVKILEAGLDAERPWFAMELLKGRTVEQRLAEEGPLPLYLVFELIRDVGAALQASHAQGLLHRDLKPANVIETQRGFVLTDFGLVKDLEIGESVRLSRTGDFLGTPGFWAPEQAGGKPSSTATDLYGLGALAYAALADEAPIQGNTFAEVWAATLNQEPTRIQELRPDVPPALATWLRRCLSKAPADRYPSIEVALAELERHPSPRRRPVLAASLVGALLGAAALLGALKSELSTDASSVARNPKSSLRKPEKVVTSQPPVTEAESPRPSPPVERGVALRWHEVSSVGIDWEVPSRLHASGGELFSSDQGIWSSTKGRVPSHLVPEGRFDVVSTTRDGRYLLAAEANQLMVWDRSGTQAARSSERHPGAIHTLIPLSNSQVLSADRSGTLALWDMSAKPRPGFSLHLLRGLRLGTQGRPMPGRRSVILCGSNLFLDDGDNVVRLSLKTQASQPVGQVEGLTSLHDMDSSHFAARSPDGMVFFDDRGQQRGRWKQTTAPLSTASGSGALFLAFPEKLLMFRSDRLGPTAEGMSLPLPATPLRAVAVDPIRAQVWLIAGRKVYASQALASSD